MSDASAATIDDISVFVIPIAPYRSEWVQHHNYSEDVENSISFDNSNTNGISESHEVAKDVLDTVMEAVESLSTKSDHNVSKAAKTKNAKSDIVLPPDLNAIDVQLEVKEPNN